MIKLEYRGQFVESIGYKTDDAAGCDVVCEADVIVPAQTCGVKLPTSMFIVDSHKEFYGKIPYLQLSLRSGMAFKSPLRLSNGVGIIDHSYPDEICLLVDNISSEDYHIKAGTPVGQLVQLFTEHIKGVPVKETKRVGGFGSTDTLPETSSFIDLHPADIAGGQASS